MSVTIKCQEKERKLNFRLEAPDLDFYFSQPMESNQRAYSVLYDVVLANDPHQNVSNYFLEYTINSTENHNLSKFTM